jgi:hypothetical protein
MLRGSSPIQLSQLDISPAIQAGALEAQAAVNLASSVNQAVQDFQAKQQEKEQKKMTANALRQFIPGLGEEVYGAIAKDPQILKSMSDLTNIQAAQQQQEILAQEQQRVQEQRDILEKAIMPNTDTSGLIDKEGVKRTFIQLGGTDESVLGLFNTPGEIRISDKGVITQDGLYKGQVATELLDIEPSEEEKEKTKLELEKRQAEIDKLNAQIAKIKGEMPTTEFDPEKLEGIDKEAYDYAITNPGTPESEQILIRLRAK